MNAGVQQFFYVLPTLDVAHAGHVRMREFVDEGELGVPRQEPIEVHFAKTAAPILQRDLRHAFDAVEQRLGFSPAMGLDDGGDNIDAFAPPLVRRLKHRVSLADTGRGAEKDLQVAASLSLRLSEKGVRRGAFVGIVVAHRASSSHIAALVEHKVELSAAREHAFRQASWIMRLPAHWRKNRSCH